jgi:Zn-dependent protease with chaperone function
MGKKLMKKALVLAMALFILTPVFAFSLPALAADTGTGGADVWGNNATGGGADNFTGTTGLGTADLRTTIANIIKLVIGFLGIIAVVIILIGGFKWMTAGGSEDKVGEAKKLIIAGIIGLVIILLAYAIASFVLDSLNTVTSSTTGV